MANLLKSFLNNVGQGLGNSKGTLGDFQHAAKLYNSNAHRLAPKTKYLYHVVFNINPAAIKSTSFGQQHLTTVNLLVKSADLPGFKISVDTVHQYNRKKNVQTKIDYDPINIAFHDDNLGVTTQLWSMYYGYYFADSNHGASAQSLGSSLEQGLVGSALSRVGLGSIAAAALGGNSAGTDTLPGYMRNTYKGEVSNRYRYGLDNNSSIPFFTSIQIYQLAKHQYQSYTIVNPIITNWKHTNLDQADSATPAANTMTIAYEAVLYGQSKVSQNNPKGFAGEFYDKTPSPLTIAGGGTTSLFGSGGVLGGIGDVLGDIAEGKAFSNPGAILGTLVKGSNIVRNSRRLSSEGLRQEGFSIIKGALGTTGAITGAVANSVFPKSSGTGQTGSRIATNSAPNTTTSDLSGSQIVKLSNTPGALSAVTRQAISTGAVPRTTTPEAMSNLLAQGGNPKLNGMAAKIANNIR